MLEILNADLNLGTPSFELLGVIGICSRQFQRLQTNFILSLGAHPSVQRTAAEMRLPWGASKRMVVWTAPYRPGVPAPHLTCGPYS